MRIVINGRFLTQRVTGVQRMAREFTHALDRLIADGELPGVSARLMVQEGAASEDFRPSAISVEVLGNSHGHWWEQAALPFACQGDVLLNLGNTAPIISLLGPQRVVTVVHDLSYRLFPDAYRLPYKLAHRALNTLLMRRADLIVTVAESEREMIARAYPSARERIVVAQNGGWTDDHPPHLGPDDRPRPGYGLYVGSMSRRKNIHGVIGAAIALGRKRGLHFKLVGSTSAILSNVATDIPADTRPLIEMMGQVDDPHALEELYRGAAFLLFPSFYEASALPPIEAMSHGCPVIASGILALVERCGDAALYCDPYDVGTMVAAAERLLDDPAAAATISAAGKVRAGGYSWRAQARTIVAAMQARWPE